MIGLGSLIALLTVAAFALFSVRVGAMALRMTGMERQTAGFQALSAFFGVGFTTREAELVVNHPVRRRIIMHLIVAGNLGIASGIGALITAIIRVDSAFDGFATFGAAAVAIGVFYGVWKLGFVERLINLAVRRGLEQFGVTSPTDYEMSLHVHAGFAVAQVEVPAGSELAGKIIVETGMNEAGVLVLGIERAGGTYVGSPDGLTSIEKGDRLTVYGHEDAIRKLREPAPGERSPDGVVAQTGASPGESPTNPTEAQPPPSPSVRTEP